ncbi:1-deoxy-D-xylulose-5-phosphate synthase [compost metagenome]
MRVLSVHTLKPLDVESLRAAATETPLVVTVEEHSVIGGLGSAVAEVLAECAGPRATLVRIGIPSEFCPTVGDQAFLRDRYGLTTAAIVRRVEGVLERAAGGALPAGV